MDLDEFFDKRAERSWQDAVRSWWWEIVAPALSIVIVLLVVWIAFGGGWLPTIACAVLAVAGIAGWCWLTQRRWARDAAKQQQRATDRRREALVDDGAEMLLITFVRPDRPASDDDRDLGVMVLPSHLRAGEVSEMITTHLAGRITVIDTQMLAAGVPVTDDWRARPADGESGVVVLLPKGTGLNEGQLASRAAGDVVATFTMRRMRFSPTEPDPNPLAPAQVDA